MSSADRIAELDAQMAASIARFASADQGDLDPRLVAAAGDLVPPGYFDRLRAAMAGWARLPEPATPTNLPPLV